MGLFDSVMGAVLGGGKPQAQGGLGGIIGSLANNLQLLKAITGMLANDGSHGGLGA